MKNVLKPAFEMLRTLCLGKTAFFSSLALRCVGTSWIQDLTQQFMVFAAQASMLIPTHTQAHTHTHTYTRYTCTSNPQQSASGTPKWKDLPWSLAFCTSKDLLPYTSKNRGELSRAYKRAKLYSWACAVCEAAGGLPAFSELSESLRKIVSVI